MEGDVKGVSSYEHTLPPKRIAVVNSMEGDVKGKRSSPRSPKDSFRVFESQGLSGHSAVQCSPDLVFRFMRDFTYVTIQKHHVYVCFHSPRYGVWGHAREDIELLQLCYMIY